MTKVFVCSFLTIGSIASASYLVAVNVAEKNKFEKNKTKSVSDLKNNRSNFEKEKLQVNKSIKPLKAKIILLNRQIDKFNSEIKKVDIEIEKIEQKISKTLKEQSDIGKYETIERNIQIAKREKIKIDEKVKHVAKISLEIQNKIIALNTELASSLETKRIAVTKYKDQQKILTDNKEKRKSDIARLLNLQGVVLTANNEMNALKESVNLKKEAYEKLLEKSKILNNCKNNEKLVSHAKDFSTLNHDLSLSQTTDNDQTEFETVCQDSLVENLDIPTPEIIEKAQNDYDCENLKLIEKKAQIKTKKIAKDTLHESLKDLMIEIVSLEAKLKVGGEIYLEKKEAEDKHEKLMNQKTLLNEQLQSAERNLKPNELEEKQQQIMTLNKNKEILEKKEEAINEKIIKKSLEKSKKEEIEKKMEPILLEKEEINSQIKQLEKKSDSLKDQIYEISLEIKANERIQFEIKTFFNK